MITGSIFVCVAPAAPAAPLGRWVRVGWEAAPSEQAPWSSDRAMHERRAQRSRSSDRAILPSPPQRAPCPVAARESVRSWSTGPVLTSERGRFASLARRVGCRLLSDRSACCSCTALGRSQTATVRVTSDKKEGPRDAPAEGRLCGTPVMQVSVQHERSMSSARACTQKR